MGWYLDGRISAVVGTHTHVPTADARVLPSGDRLHQRHRHDRSARLDHRLQPRDGASALHAPPADPLPRRGGAGVLQCGADRRHRGPRDAPARSSRSSSSSRCRASGSPGGRLGIVGPTASGKTDLALAIADRICPSRSSSRTRDRSIAAWISAPPRPRRPRNAAVPHHLIDLVAPDAPFTVADWLGRPRARLPAIAARGRLPLWWAEPGCMSPRSSTATTRRPALVPELRQRLADELETRWPRAARRAPGGGGSGLGRGDRPAQPATGAAGPRARGGRRRRSPAIAAPTAGQVATHRPRLAESGALPTDRRACERALRGRPSRGGAALASGGIRSRAAADDRAWLCRGRRLPGGGVEPGRGRGGHRTSHAAVREAPADVVPPRPASHLDPARGWALRTPTRWWVRPSCRAASGAQLIGSPIDWRQAATPLMASVGVVIGVITGTIA